LTGKEWKDKWGEPDAEVKGKYWKYEYKRFGVVVKLIYLEPDEHIISFDVTPAAPVPASLLYQNIEHFIPEDALYIEDYPRPLGPGTVSRFNSEWLAKRFLSLNDPVVSDWFPGGNPGDFILLYEEDATGNVDNVIVGLGNNP
jgi:hypothetical protein